jgi:hypothetical protein
MSSYQARWRENLVGANLQVGPGAELKVRPYGPQALSFS